MDKDRAFISVLTTDNYLPGLLVLNASLKSVNSQYPLHVLLTHDISKKVTNELNKNSIPHSFISKQIINPTNVRPNHRWFPTYSKLSVFDQVQYKKIVYLDVDMLVLRNIDELFQYQHMSGANAGSMLPRKKDSKNLNLNTGLMVIEPSHLLFDDMMDKVGRIENLESGGDDQKPIRGSDQDFINAYYPDWPNWKHLHLDHKYNLFHYHLDEYSKLFGYSIKDGVRPVKVIHYASYLKPWDIKQEDLNKLLINTDKSLELEAIHLWIDSFHNIVNMSL